MKRLSSGDRRALHRDASNERLVRLGSGAGDSKSEERLLRRQQSDQREALLRDLERQLGLEPGAPAVRETRESRPGTTRRDARDTRSGTADQRREIAQRARKLLEDLGSLEPGEDLSSCAPSPKHPLATDLCQSFPLDYPT